MCGLLIKNLNAHNLQLHRQHCGQFKNVNKTSTISNFFKKLTNSASKKSSTSDSQELPKENNIIDLSSDEPNKL